MVGSIFDLKKQELFLLNSTQPSYQCLFLMTQIPWQRIVSSLFEDGVLGANSKVYVRNPLYFQLLNDLLRNESQSQEMKR